MKLKFQLLYRFMPFRDRFLKHKENKIRYLKMIMNETDNPLFDVITNTVHWVYFCSRSFSLNNIQYIGSVNSRQKLVCIDIRYGRPFFAKLHCNALLETEESRSFVLSQWEQIPESLGNIHLKIIYFLAIFNYQYQYWSTACTYSWST